MNAACENFCFGFSTFLEMIDGVLALSIRIESTSSIMQ
ncbi:translocase subunit secA domain protein [Synechococcus sp. RS9915]|nr:translocase subunit secA domain protein [Synechococcus sp. RS9915]